MRRILTTVFVLVTVIAADAGQQTPTFRATTRLIVQTVIVKDKRGIPVEGLTARDFAVSEDGQSQTIAFVEFQRLDARPLSAFTLVTSPSGAPPPSLPPAPVASVTAPAVRVPTSGDPRYSGKRLMVLYFDLLNMGFFDEIRMYEQATKYITTRMTSADLIALMEFRDSAVHLRLDFTDDRAALLEAIAALQQRAENRQNGVIDAAEAGGAFGQGSDEFNVFSTDRQLAALQTAVTDLGPLPQLKTLIYLGSGLRLNGADNQAQLRATVNAAVRSNVTINPIDTRGLVATAPLGDATKPSPGGVGMFNGQIVQTAATRQQRSQDTYYALAKDTGGVATFDNNDLSSGMERAAQAVTGYYILGYYSSHDAKDGRFRRVKVTLNSEVTADLAYRAGYFGDKDFSKFTRADKERQLEEALRLEDPITEIPIAMEVNYFQLNQAEYFVPISVRMPGSELARPRPGGATTAEIDMIGEIKDEFGVTHRNMRDKVQFKIDNLTATQLAAGTIQYETGYTLLPGNYVIKVLARDATTGRIGTFLSPFVVPNLDREKVRLPISTVVLSSQQQPLGDALHSVKQKVASDAVNPLVHDGVKTVPSVTRTFNRDRPLFVFLQAYERDAAAMRPLVAFVSLYKGAARIFEAAPIDVKDGWDPKSKAVPIRFVVPLTEVQPGEYDCQVTVLDPASGKAAFWRAPIVIKK